MGRRGHGSIWYWYLKLAMQSLLELLARIPLMARGTRYNLMVGSVLLLILDFCFVLCFFALHLCILCPILPLSPDCPFFIASSVFSHINLLASGQFSKTFLNMSLFPSL